MWLSLFIALLTYLLSPKGDATERRKALMNAAIAGGVTYGVTEYTDWGADISDQFDGAIGVGSADTTPTPGGTPAAGKTGVSKWLSDLNWGSVATGAGAGLLLGGSGATSWLIPAGIAVAAYLLLRN